jgi:D-alanine-D-alanine ligase
MDKIVFKDVMGRAGLPQVAYWSLTARRRGAGRPVRGQLPVLGQAVAAGLVGGDRPRRRARRARGAIEAAAAHDPRVIVEATRPGIEVECSCSGPTDAPQASQPGEILLAGGEGGWYDYEAKYTPGGMELVGARADPAAARERVRELAVTAFRLAGCSGLARADFFVDGDDVLLNELNTMPGFTQTSVYGKLWDHSGIAYPELCDRLVRISHRALRAAGGPYRYEDDAPGRRRYYLPLCAAVSASGAIPRRASDGAPKTPR